MTLSVELADIFRLLEDGNVQARTAAILEIARQVQPDNIGPYLMGIGMGELIGLGRSDAEIVAMTSAALGKLRELIVAIDAGGRGAPS